ncbi:CD225/dispanin family protein [Mycobacterium sp. HNNTM2301]|uniref:CD225/dispanin family protein n=1 Tax=Mycobacterium hainanense TaxID=3289775 RepID=UPI0035A6CEFE
MSYPPGPYEGSPEWQGQQPEWQGQQPEWQGQPPGGQGQPPGWPGQQPGWPAQQPGWPAPQPGWPGQQEPDNYLVWAILCTVLCCLPFGIVSIVYSTKVSGLWSQGRYAEAQAAADNAKKWAIIGAVAGGVFAVIMVILYVAIGVIAVSNLPSTTTTTYSGF